MEPVDVSGDGVFAVRGPFEPPLLTGHEASLRHQPSRAVTPDPMAVADEIPMHPWVTIGAIRQGEGRAVMRKVNHSLPQTLAAGLVFSRLLCVAILPHPACQR